MPFKRLRLVVFFAAAIAVSSAGIGKAGHAIDSPVMIGLASTGANLWVDSNGGQCTRSGTPAVYRDASACGTIDAAWDVCRPGDTIIIRAGVYAAQTVTGDKAAPGCTVKGESTTTIGDLVTGGAYLTLNNVTIDVGAAKQAGWKARASHVTLNDVRLHGPFVAVEIFRVSNVRWIGGELGIAGRLGGARVCGQDAQPVQLGEADHITISGVSFHPQDADLTPSNCSVNGQHLEMIRIDGGTSFFTLRNSTFDNGDHSNTASIFITEPGGSEDPHDLTFENNFFGTNGAVTGTFYSHVNVSPCVDFTFAYNTFLEGPGSLECTSAVKSTWIGNLGPLPPEPICLGTHIDNVWQDPSRDNCGSDKWVTGARLHTDQLGLGGSDGFHLQAGSPAIDAGEADGYCNTALGSVDHDGGPRHVGPRCDAGADEFQHGETVVGSLSRARWSRKRSGVRVLTVTLRIGERVAADVRLVRGSSTIARETYPVLRPPVRKAVLILGENVAAGSAAVKVTLKDVAGNERVIRSSVQVPR